MDKVPNSLVRISPHPFGNEWLDSIFAAPKKALEPFLKAKVLSQNDNTFTPKHSTRTELAKAANVSTVLSQNDKTTGNQNASKKTTLSRNDKVVLPQVNTQKELAKAANVSLQPAPPGMCIVCWNYWAKELWAGHCVCTGHVAVRPGGQKLPRNPQLASATALQSKPNVRHRRVIAAGSRSDA